MHQAIPHSVRSKVHKAFECKGDITSSYAQIEFLIGDLLQRCSYVAEYGAASNLSRSTPKRILNVRRLVAMDGPLQKYEKPLIELMNRFEEEHDLRNLIAHGSTTVEFTRAGGAALFIFKIFHREQNSATWTVRSETLTIGMLRQEKEKMVRLANEALQLFMVIHADLGWIGALDPETAK
jgi:hypothetical protein